MIWQGYWKVQTADFKSTYQANFSEGEVKRADKRAGGKIRDLENDHPFLSSARSASTAV
jgi:hypothetical protein